MHTLLLICFAPEHYIKHNLGPAVNNNLHVFTAEHYYLCSGSRPQPAMKQGRGPYTSPSSKSTPFVVDIGNVSFSVSSFSSISLPMPAVISRQHSRSCSSSDIRLRSYKAAMP